MTKIHYKGDPWIDDLKKNGTKIIMRDFAILFVENIIKYPPNE